MPELPEVETIVRALRLGGRDGPSITGWTLVGARILWGRTLAEPSEIEFLQHIPDQVVQDVGRRGKFIFLRLTRDYLIFHLRMSGDLRVERDVNEHGDYLELSSHDRFVITFNNGYRLVFCDARKFGRVWLVDNPETIFASLGPEPLDSNLTPRDLYRRLQQHHRQLKPLLLDQSFLAGLGNIYSDEVLHLARLHPLQPAHTLSEDDAATLLSAIQKVLEEGIHNNGASIDWVYRGGNFQNNFRVYQRTGKPCVNCGSYIERITVGQRGTHYCPHCQSLR